MDKRARTKLIVAAVLVAVGLVVFLAWWDAAHPLRYLRADRVMTAQVGSLASKGLAGRDLSAEETAELCRLLVEARSTGPVEASGTIRVELVTVDLGRIEVEDLSGPGARAAVAVGTSDEQRFTLRSTALAEFLAGIGRTLATKDNSKRPAAD